MQGPPVPWWIRILGVVGNVREIVSKGHHQCHVDWMAGHGHLYSGNHWAGLRSALTPMFHRSTHLHSFLPGMHLGLASIGSACFGEDLWFQQNATATLTAATAHTEASEQAAAKLGAHSSSTHPAPPHTALPPHTEPHSTAPHTAAPHTAALARAYGANEQAGAKLGALSSLLLALFPLSLRPWVHALLGVLPGSTVGAARERHRELMKAWKRMLEAKRQQQSQGNNSAADILTFLKSFRDKGTGATLLEYDLPLILFGLLGAGVGTTSSTLAFAVLMLTQHPEVAWKLQAEIDRYFEEREQQGEGMGEGKGEKEEEGEGEGEGVEKEKRGPLDTPASFERGLSFEGLEELKYLDMVVKETLRLYPAAPVAARLPVHATTLAGYHIPANTPVVVPIFAAHRCPDFFPRPLSFLPERFGQRATAEKKVLGNEAGRRKEEESRAIIDGLLDDPTLIDFSFPDQICGTWHHNYMRMHQQIRAASKNPSAAPPPDTPPVKFLTFDGLSHCDSLGETLMGLTSAFTVALLTNRAFVIKHPCIPMAFEPALIDWQPTEDVGFEPVRNENFPLDPSNRAVNPPIGASDIVEINLELHPEAHPEKVFPQVEAARNLRVVWNKDLLVHMLKGANGSVWGERLMEMGIRIPYAFGCFVRYLLRPKPEVWHRMQPFEKHLRGDKVVSIGMHDVENWWYPPFLNVKWLVISDSLQLKQKAIEVNESKIVITEFDPWVPPSLLSISPPPPPPPPPPPAPAPAPPPSVPSSDPATPTTTTPEGPPLPPIPTVQEFQETVTEWLLLSSCNSFIVSTSAFGRTAAMYSMRPMSMHMPRSCDPQTPVRVSSFGEESKRQF
ncbi:unnamed protein product [Closterium sp. Yama58-4]|nr:unnamed protein product [Closterium sp. Yama58-4]